ncbi:MAG TPA: M15 family metallopeptidase [Solirubrobacterales bacterium]|nr:M15 family metallopeptidase [Solirubrobacterales bacterium]
MLVAAIATLAAALAAGGEPAFEGRSEPIRGAVEERIVGSSWHRGCPVHHSKLRLLEVSHWGFDGEVHRGRLIVHGGHDRAILGVMQRLFERRYPIRRMELIDRYGADDRRSMAADNTSAFNCRFVAGTNRWSMHAYGKAIDINPTENPYVSGSHVSPPDGEPFADRSRDAEGMIHAGDAVVRAFAGGAGWRWGGAWPGSTKDYQHFSSNGG